MESLLCTSTHTDAHTHAHMHLWGMCLTSAVRLDCSVFWAWLQSSFGCSESGLLLLWLLRLCFPMKKILALNMLQGSISGYHFMSWHGIVFAFAAWSSTSFPKVSFCDHKIPSFLTSRDPSDSCWTDTSSSYSHNLFFLLMECHFRGHRLSWMVARVCCDPLKARHQQKSHATFGLVDVHEKEMEAFWNNAFIFHTLPGLLPLTSGLF